MTVRFSVRNAQCIDTYAASFSGAVAKAEQLSGGWFEGRTEILFAPRISICRSVANQLTRVVGQLHPDFAAFSLHSAQSNVTSLGTRFHHGEVSYLSGGNAYDVITTPNHSMLTVHVEHSYLASRVSADTLAKLQLASRPDHPLKLASPVSAQQLVDEITSCFNRYCDRNSETTTTLSEKAPNNQCWSAWLDQIVARLADTIVESSIDTRRQNTRAKLLERAFAVISSERTKVLTVQQLAQRVGTSMRNLQVVFNESLGISPGEYMLNQRLNKVREQILRVNANGIAEFAHAGGWSHMGNFSKSYFRLFQELPSETLKRKPIDKLTRNEKSES